MLALTALLGCAGRGVDRDQATVVARMTTCPATPNCVSSDADGSARAIAPFTIAGNPTASWRALVAYVESQPRLTIKIQDVDYLHVEARSRVLRFVDDIEFQLRATEGQIAVRSASRVGLSDLGANRRRVEQIRSALIDDGVLKRTE